MVTINNSTVSGNSTTDTSAGAILNESGTLTLTNSTVSGNSALHDGGGIDNVDGTVTLTASTVSGNNATHGVGGGIDNVRGTMTLTNSTISGNSASAGGGIANSGTLTLTNSTVSGNSVLRFAGGIANYDNTTLTNSIVADQTSGGDCFNVSGVIASSGYNLDSDNTCNLTDPTDLPDGNANLGPLQNNGDSTFTHALLPGSNAIDAGDCSGGTVTTDQRGVARPQGAACDIGAIEFQPSDTTPPMVTIVSVTPDTLWPPNGKLVPVTIVATITDAGSGVDPNTTAYAVEDEYGSVEPSGSLTLRADGRYTATIPLQASRRGNDRDGRLYTITVSALDNEGNEGSATAFVIVPHDQGQGRSRAARKRAPDLPARPERRARVEP